MASILFASPQPSAPTPRPLYDEILGKMLQGIADALPLDGVLLELHGSMAVGDLDAPGGLADAEGHILTAVRETVGPDVPVLAQLDIHSNVSQRMVSMADVLIGRAAANAPTCWSELSAKASARPWHSIRFPWSGA